MSWAGLRLVAGLELRRHRGRRPLLLLACWAAALVVVGGLVLARRHPAVAGANSTVEGWAQARTGAGESSFAAVAILALGSLLLVLPGLAAAAVPRDREAGMLAPLQGSLLRPAQIIGGKTLALWLVGLALLAAAAPGLVPGAIFAGYGVGRAAATLGLLAGIALAVAMLCVGIGALTAGRRRAVIRAYQAVAVGCVLLPMVWLASFPLLRQQVPPPRGDQEMIELLNAVDIDAGPEEISRYLDAHDLRGYAVDPRRDGVGNAPGPMLITVCTPASSSQTVPRSDALLGLAAPNPLILLSQVLARSTDATVLGDIRDGYARASDPLGWVLCEGQDPVPSPRPAWPVGLALWFLAGGGTALLAVHRLSVPMSGGTR
ncbi:hypothetical protein [Brachybacterium hainanense]|uniref:ABC transporter permease n=1 Tax=Brachybacterium hainanense TaxID=1541174 RepID=A0ABV6RIJ2_9MICO